MITFLAAILVLIAIGTVSWPLLRGVGTKREPASLQDSEVSELLIQKDATLFAINELESDYEIGSLSQGDYQELREKYEEKAVALIKTVDELRSERGLGEERHIDEEIEARVLSLRRARSTTEEDIEAGILSLRQARSTTEEDIEAGILSLRQAKSTNEADIESRVSKLRRANKAAPNGKACPSCGAPMQPDAVFCSRCGTALITKCPGCSAQVSAEALFCFRCGMALSEEGKRKAAN